MLIRSAVNLVGDEASGVSAVVTPLCLLKRLRGQKPGAGAARRVAGGETEGEAEGGGGECRSRREENAEGQQSETGHGAQRDADPLAVAGGKIFVWGWVSQPDVAL